MVEQCLFPVSRGLYNPKSEFTGKIDAPLDVLCGCENENENEDHDLELDGRAAHEQQVEQWG